MIASLRGRVLASSAGIVVLECGGVGFQIHATPAAIACADVGEEATLQTTLVVKEDSLTLFGFANDAERAAFAAVQTVSGIGPRTALALLAQLTPAQLAQAVASGDTAALKRVPGIGQKGAQRLVLELAGRLVGVGAPSATTDAGPAGEVRAALVGLGWPRQDAIAAIDAAREAGAPDDVPGLLKAALRMMGRKA